MNRQKRGLIYSVVAGLLAASCSSSIGNVGSVQSYPVTALEANWVRDGEGLEFENEQWIPQDEVEVFVDPEMQPMGVYRGVQFFSAKADVRPYSRLYTKFSRNQFRVFERAPAK